MLRLVSSKDGDVRMVGREEASLPVADSCGRPDIVEALRIRSIANGLMEWFTGAGSSDVRSTRIDYLGSSVLLLPPSEQWREAVSTAVLGSWCDPLLATGKLPATALGALRAEARQLHKQLVPLWRRGTRHGRVLSLDAAIGDDLSLYDLVAANVDLLARAAGGVFADERLNRVLRALTPDEQQVVYAYAEGEGTTWTEAAAVVGATGPEAFGERVRRKVKRLAAEQARRTAPRRTQTARDFLPVAPPPRTER